MWGVAEERLGLGAEWVGRVDDVGELCRDCGQVWRCNGEEGGRAAVRVEVRGGRESVPGDRVAAGKGFSEDEVYGNSATWPRREWGVGQIYNVIYSTYLQHHDGQPSSPHPALSPPAGPPTTS